MTDKHPSGMSWERWNWPFKTPEERKMAARYFKQMAREEKQKQRDSVGKALL